MTQPLGQGQQNAYDMLTNMLAQWGLGELAPDVLKLVQEGRTQDQIPVLIQDTEAYKRRFSGNELRRKAGRPVLNPSEYLSIEESYRRILQSNGLPVGFYDSPADFADWIGKDVSPQEVSTRVSYAVDASQRLDDGTKRAFAEYYGVMPNDLAAFFLDQERALPFITQQARAARIGAAGFNDRVGFDRATAEHLATSTLVGDTELESAVSTVADLDRDVGKLGDIYGDRYSAEQAAQEVFFADPEARRRRKKLVEQEQATFSGNSGVGRSSLSQSKTY